MMTILKNLPKKIIKNQNDFEDLLFVQESLKNVHKDTFIKCKEDEDAGEMIVEIINPTKEQNPVSSVGINKNDFVLRRDMNPALFGLLKLADPSTDEHKYILGSAMSQDDAQMHMWNAEIDLYDGLDSNPFAQKLKAVNRKYTDQTTIQSVLICFRNYTEKEKIFLSSLLNQDVLINNRRVINESTKCFLNRSQLSSKKLFIRCKNGLQTRG